MAPARSEERPEHDQIGRAITRLEGGLTERQKAYLRATLVELVAAFLQEEAVVEGSLATYSQVYDLTQDGHFLNWQQRVLSRSPEDTSPAETVLGYSIQLEQVDILLQASCGYLMNVRRMIGEVSARIRATGNAVFHAYGGRVAGVQTKDKDGVAWQMYTAASVPDSTVVRRVRKDVTRKQEAASQHRRTKKPGFRPRKVRPIPPEESQP